MKHTLALLVAAAIPAAALAHDEVSKTGTVREVMGGPTSRAELAGEDGQTYVLRGRTPADDDELRRLAGVKVRLFGAAEASSRFAVERFEILDIGGGVVPQLGMIAELPGDKRLLFVDAAGHATFLPPGFTPKLRDQIGAKVWIVGTARGDRLQVSRFAILRPGRSPTPPPAAPKTP